MGERKIEIYESDDGWRWRKIGGNGEIVSHGEAYTTKYDVIEGALDANPEIPEDRVYEEQDED